VSEVSIVKFSPEYAPDFARLNYEWIEKYFAIEQHDHEILDDPQTWVIDPGGEVLMALINGEAVGTVALIPAGEGILELTKMAVSPSHHGRGIGDLLMRAAIEHARVMRTRVIFLETHHSLAPAMSLYHKHGFVDTPPDPNSEYSRADVRMELVIHG
jgi:ribosomal protein S18 acetylase RimI-like enzyme